MHIHERAAAGAGVLSSWNYRKTRLNERCFPLHFPLHFVHVEKIAAPRLLRRPCLCVAINGERVGWRPHDTYVCVIYTRGVGAAVALCPV